MEERVIRTSTPSRTRTATGSRAVGSAGGLGVPASRIILHAGLEPAAWPWSELYQLSTNYIEVHTVKLYGIIIRHQQRALPACTRHAAVASRRRSHRQRASGKKAGSISVYSALATGGPVILTRPCIRHSCFIQNRQGRGRENDCTARGVARLVLRLEHREHDPLDPAGALGVVLHPLAHRLRPAQWPVMARFSHGCDGVIVSPAAPRL